MPIISLAFHDFIIIRWKVCLCLIAEFNGKNYVIFDLKTVSASMPISFYKKIFSSCIGIFSSSSNSCIMEWAAVFVQIELKYLLSLELLEEVHNTEDHESPVKHPDLVGDFRDDGKLWLKCYVGVQIRSRCLTRCMKMILTSSLHAIRQIASPMVNSP